MITVNKSIDINKESYPKCPYSKELCNPNILFNEYSINKKDKCLTCEHWKSNYKQNKMIFSYIRNINKRKLYDNSK